MNGSSVRRSEPNLVREACERLREHNFDAKKFQGDVMEYKRSKTFELPYWPTT